VIVAVSNHERLSKNKTAGRSIIARRLRHAWSGKGQNPVTSTLVLLLSAATKVAR
jgi:hypothetical protein